MGFLSLFQTLIGEPSVALIIPYTFADDVSLVDAVTTNANNSYILNAIQNTYAQFMNPTNAAQATFGGTANYTFPTTLTVNQSIATDVLYVGGIFVGSGGIQSNAGVLVLGNIQATSAAIAGSVSAQDVSSGTGEFSGNVNIAGTLTAAQFSGPLVGSISATQVLPGTFGAGSYTFSGGLTINSALSVGGNLTCGGFTSNAGGSFGGALSIVGALTVAGNITSQNIAPINVIASGSGTFHGVAVGGALTTATTGSFSGSVTMGALTATTGTFSSTLASTGLASTGGITATTGIFSSSVSTGPLTVTGGGTFPSGNVTAVNGLFSGQVQGISAVISGAVFADDFTLNGSAAANGQMFQSSNIVIFSEYQNGGGFAFTNPATNAYANVKCGTLTATSPSTPAQSSFVPPVYGPTGSPAGNNIHIVYGTGTTDGSGNLAVTPTNAAAFTTSFVVMASANGIVNQSIGVFYSGTNFTIEVSVSDTGAPSPGINLTWVAIGY